MWCLLIQFYISSSELVLCSLLSLLFLSNCKAQNVPLRSCSVAQSDSCDGPEIHRQLQCFLVQLTLLLSWFYVLFYRFILLSNFTVANVPLRSSSVAQCASRDGLEMFRVRKNKTRRRGRHVGMDWVPVDIGVQTRSTSVSAIGQKGRNARWPRRVGMDRELAAIGVQLFHRKLHVVRPPTQTQRVYLVVYLSNTHKETT